MKIRDGPVKYGMSKSSPQRQVSLIKGLNVCWGPTEATSPDSEACVGWWVWKAACPTALTSFFSSDLPHDFTPRSTFLSTPTTLLSIPPTYFQLNLSFPFPFPFSFLKNMVKSELFLWQKMTSSFSSFLLLQARYLSKI